MFKFLPDKGYAPIVTDTFSSVYMQVINTGENIDPFWLPTGIEIIPDVIDVRLSILHESADILLGKVTIPKMPETE